MAEILFHDSPIHTAGDLPAIGAEVPSFVLTDRDLAERGLSEFKGRKIVMNIFPSIDTPVCAMSVRRFNTEAASRSETVVLCISADLPFAFARFCGAEGLDSVVTLSDFRHKEFGVHFGVRIMDSALTGLLARSVLVVDELGIVVYSEMVPDTGQEPDYEAALAALS